MPKKKHTQEIPIRGRCIDDPLGMPIVMERLLAAPRLIHLQGIRGVGKTTFAFKVVFSLLEQKPDASVLWIYFDDEIEYWRTAFEQLMPDAPVAYLKIDTKSMSHFVFTLIKWVKADHYRMVIIDGLQYANLELGGSQRAQFMNILNHQAKDLGLPILVTDRQHYPPDREAEKFKDITPGPGESWRLHHPMYRNAALGEGNKFVIMPREMEWEEKEKGQWLQVP